MSNKNQILNGDVPEKIIDKIRLTIVKDYGNIRSFMKIALPFSVILTTKAIYSSIFGVIPVGTILLQNIIEFKVVKNVMVGLAYFRQGIVIKYQKGNQTKEVFFFVWKNKLESFAHNLKKLGLREAEPKNFGLIRAISKWFLLFLLFILVIVSLFLPFWAGILVIISGIALGTYLRIKSIKAI